MYGCHADCLFCEVLVSVEIEIEPLCDAFWSDGVLSWWLWPAPRDGANVAICNLVCGPPQAIKVQGYVCNLGAWKGICRSFRLTGIPGMWAI